MSPERVEVRRQVLSANEELAAENRGRLAGRGIYALNMISSPGSGKTTLLERTIDVLKDDLALGVIAGDVQTQRDAERLVQHGIVVEAIETGGSCHLDARRVAKSLAALDLSQLDLVFIENVGNLVCPSSFDLGESAKIVLMSVTEGEDKPLKYPAAFQRARVFVLTKTDLVPHLDFSTQLAIDNARLVNPDLEVFTTSSVTGEGLGDWTDWLSERAEECRRSAEGART